MNELLVIFFCLAAGGTIKGVAGMGLPLVAIPGIAAFLDVPYAIAILTIPILTANLSQVWRFRAHSADLPFLPRLVVMSLIGIAAGTLLLTSLPARFLSLGLALVMLAYIALRLLHPQVKLAMARATAIAPAIGFLAGTLQGATGISAPVSVTFMNALRLERPKFVFAVSVLFTSFAVAQLPSLALAGILTWQRLMLSIAALVPVFLGMRLGQWLGRDMKPGSFDRLILAILAVITVKLFADALF
ncbi:sulfite exporter TauE/SafE family protein [Afifella marina]|uniref:Probable membrane transporter protein n=1 Tax=Afifella marina DSM 2698 TaxID=1120955 RepID=A0A1G5P9F7_AFIMA|nr:sulfite exporter TauE/SafE family protein [Afifella marina]MBK1624370.1 sulfite exporter TauE/SafE family protein [Afifella marina DSM 2698]MBK1628102.1 sulfite exporter TauE/SafE family protein [Afifella marina]MBK5916536.1 hypothetical protein [Afifella marina]RAI18907.1 hypothetical protein CH311_13615 [Afifella marina DSM 2698]SCZ46203.1 hypothetical protein SAMN03080610_03593 [Afifella marina DSM 2698]